MNPRENSLLELYKGKGNLKEFIIFFVTLIITTAVTWDLIKKGIIIQLPIIAMVLYTYRIQAKEIRLQNFREEINQRNFTQKDLQELANLTRKRSADSKNLLNKITAAIGVIVLPGYSWLIVELLKGYFSGNLAGNILLFFLTVSAIVVALMVWATAAVEKFSTNYQYKEISEILEGIQIDRLVERYQKKEGKAQHNKQIIT